jgi:hypothetical protein
LAKTSPRRGIIYAPEYGLGVGVIDASARLFRRDSADVKQDDETYDGDDGQQDIGDGSGSEGHGVVLLYITRLKSSCRDNNLNTRALLPP